MSDKRINTDANGDPRVSEVYRDLAAERTPEHLDHVILNAARREARPRWNRAAAWLRPAAWVATIGVCLAIVIEISLLPDSLPTEDAAWDATDAASDEPAAAPPETPGDAGKQLELLQQRPAKTESLQRMQRPGAATAAKPSARRDEQVAEEKAAADRAAPAAKSVVEALEDRDAGLLGEAEIRARQEADGNGRLAPVAVTAAPAGALALEASAERYCDEEQTGDPNSWLDCILELERQGLHDAARIERDLLTETFPPPELILPPQRP